MASDDTEFNALTKIVKELTPLDQAARDRVLGYAVARFGTQLPTVTGVSIQRGAAGALD